jgi:hypothetical protein
MSAAAGQVVQYANEEFWCWKNHELIKPGETNESAFVRAKQNQTDTYTTVHTIQAHSQELCEVNLQLVAEEQAKEQNTTVALNLMKTFFFAVSWIFHKNGQPVMKLSTRTPALALTWPKESRKHSHRFLNHDYTKIWISTWCYVFHWEGMQ